jgi:hypothetical protein
MMTTEAEDAVLPCDFREEDGHGCESGWCCTVCDGWFSWQICDGVEITNRWWQPVDDCLAAARERDEAR